MMPNTDDSSPSHDLLNDSKAPLVRRLLGKAVEAHIIYPVIAIIALAAIWGSTLILIKDERAAAEHSAVVSNGKLVETYESQVLRAVREIDQTLKFVKYAVEVREKSSVLKELKAKTLLLPDFVFTVSITNAEGDVVASTRPPHITNVAKQDYFLKLLNTDTLIVSYLSQHSDHSGHSDSEAIELHFSRRLDAPDEEFSGIVTVSVDAAYFVSGYETSQLGEHGVLGILGSDGTFLVRRSGETVTAAGDSIDYAAVVTATEDADAVLMTNSWDGVQRYTSANQLYGFPLAVIVGLSEDEQLAPIQQSKQVYLWRAGASSLLLIAILAVLGRMSWQLALSRQRAIEEHIAHAERVEHLAYHDSLTALPNRTLFSKLLSQGINQMHRHDRQLAVMFLDLDYFKNINDTLGHEAGDQLLQEVAVRLKTCLRGSDTVARLGGDEFVILLPELDVEKYTTTVAQKILSVLAKPFILIDQEFRVTASVGISIYPQDGLDEQTLTKNADIAMYQAKEAGKNNFQFYSEKLNNASLERLNLESGLRHALVQNEFQLFYQSKRDINGRITGMEALLRWEHPDLGMVAPMKFIPLAEETGLIIPIGKWVLRTACLQSVAWQKQGLLHLNMAVNLTARQFFDKDLIADLTKILEDTGMQAHLLELEITEGMLMRDVEKTMAILTAIKEKGIRIAIDDFGIGYTSLVTLKQFPLDTVKIDRSFIRHIANVDEDKALTGAIIAMGRRLSLTVVAQGVETKEQAEFLRKNACDEFQGFYLNKPMSVDQMTELLAQHDDINMDAGSS